MMRLFAHFDIDAFYAQVEQLLNPSLRGKPVIVGGNSLRRSVVASASYEARPYGISSGMPIFEAKKLCPSCIIIPPRFSIYEEYSRRFYSMLYSFSPDLEIISQDEAVIDLTHCNILYPDAVQEIRNFRKNLIKKLGLTVSTGVSSSKFIAKLAASRAKPNGFLYIPPKREKEFLMTFSLKDLPGIGRKTLAILRNLGIRSVSDLMKVSPNILGAILGKRGEDIIITVKLEGRTETTLPSRSKSISRGYTLERDILTLEEAKPHLLYLSDVVAMKMRKEGARGERVCLRIRWSDFRETQRCLSMFPPANDTITIFSKIMEISREIIGKKRIRLLSVEVSSLSYVSQQTLIVPKEEKLMDAVEKIRKKYGFSSIKFLGEESENNQGVFVFQGAKKLIK